MSAQPNPIFSDRMRVSCHKGLTKISFADGDLQFHTMIVVRNEDAKLLAEVLAAAVNESEAAK